MRVILQACVDLGIQVQEFKTGSSGADLGEGELTLVDPAGQQAEGRQLFERLLLRHVLCRVSSNIAHRSKNTLSHVQDADLHGFDRQIVVVARPAKAWLSLLRRRKREGLRHQVAVAELVPPVLSFTWPLSAVAALCTASE